MPNKRSINMTSSFTLEGIERLKQTMKEQKTKDTILTFKDPKGALHHWKVKVTKDNRVLGKEIQMGDPEGLMVVEELDKERK